MIKTVVSQKSHEYLYGSRVLLDTPGHPKLWNLDIYLRNTKKIIFTIDSTTNDVSMSARYLLAVLSHPLYTSHKPQMMVLLTKTDHVNSLPMTRLIKRLEQQMYYILFNY